MSHDKFGQIIRKIPKKRAPVPRHRGNNVIIVPPKSILSHLPFSGCVYLLFVLSLTLLVFFTLIGGNSTKKNKVKNRSYENANVKLGSCYWIMRAKSLKYSNKRKAENYFEKAEKAAGKNSSEWIVCAKGWKNIFSDSINAKRCLNMAEKYAHRNSREWMNCAVSWVKMFDDTARAHECLEKAENVIYKNSGEWITCANIWKELFNNTARARECLEKAEAVADNSYDWKLCVGGWEELNDKSRIKKCWKKIEFLD